MTDRNNNPATDEYTIAWKDKKNPGIKHFVSLRGYGAKLIADLLKENGYEHSVHQDGVEVTF